MARSARRWLIRMFAPPSERQSRWRTPHARERFRPGLEALEGREVPTIPTWTGAVSTDFGDPDNIRTGGVLSGTITGLSTTTINSVFASPTNFYYNLHNGSFPAGAVRDQLPEPASVGLLATGAGLLLRRRR